MSTFFGKIRTSSVVVIDRGLNDVNITDADVRTGKASINNKGEKIIGNSIQRFVERSTADATATPADINLSKTLYVNGKKIIGTYTEPTVENTVQGRSLSYRITEGNITVGDFVKISGSGVAKISSISDVILGIATQSGVSGSNIIVRVPFN